MLEDDVKQIYQEEQKKENSFLQKAKRALFKATLWGTLTAFSWGLFPGVYFGRKAYAQGNEGKIAFVSDRDGNDEIYVMDSDGRNVRRLTNNPAWDWSPSWSPDGSKIAFASTGIPWSFDIYVMDSDGRNQRNLTNNPSDDWTLAWSPDGSKIAFVSDRDGNLEIYVMDSDGSNQKRLTNNPADDWYPSWSPDGTKIAFHSDRNGNLEIYVMDSDGSNQKRLTRVKDFFPSWSPDGTEIAFHSQRGGGNWEIYVMDSDGRNQKNLTNNPAHDRSPSWSKGSVGQLPSPDTTPPSTTNLNPQKNSTNIPPDTNVYLEIKDDSNVDKNTLELLVNGSRANPVITPIENGFSLLYDPPTNFNFNQAVTVKINAKDVNGNSLSEEYSFTTKQAKPDLVH